MKPEDLNAHIAKGTFLPVYLLHGKEPYPLDRAAQALRAAVLTDPSTESLNYDRLEGSEVSGAAILESSRTMPMLAQRRFVLVKAAEKLVASDLERLMPCITSPAPTTVLVFQGPLDLRLKFVKALDKAGGVVRFEPLKDRAVPSWIQGEARAKGMELDSRAAYLLASLIGNNLARLADLLEQLYLYKGGEGRVSEEDVLQVGADTRGATVFMLNDAIAEGRRGEALDQYRRLTEGGTAGLMILAMLARQMRHGAIAMDMLASGGSTDDVAKALESHRFVAMKAVELGRKMRPQGARMAMALITDTDKALKSSPLKERMLMERLVLSLVDLVG